MKLLLTLAFTLLSVLAMAQPDLDFQTTQGGWTAGSLSKIYTATGSPAASVSVSVGGATSAFVSNTPEPFSRGLQFMVNYANNTDCVTATLKFSPAIQGLTFKLYNVDRAVGTGPTFGFVDQVTVSGQYNGVTVTPTISASGTSGTYSSISGNVVTGTGDTPSSDPGNVVTFAGAVTEITIAYCNNTAQTQADPGPSQSITIGDLFWSGVLPVGLVSFQVKPLAGQVAVSWETAWEQNSSHFEVQRSADAREFTTVGRVAAAGEANGRRTYGLLDETPLPGQSYYRLKQTDADAAQTSTYSRMVALTLEAENPALMVLGNPTGGEQISVFSQQIDPESLELYTVTGRQIPFTLNRQSAGKSVLVLKNSLFPGLYLLSGRQGANRLVTKFVVQL